MAPERAPAFQWYPKDFLTDETVGLMSYTERGIYITLLSRCWVEKSLPSDMGELAALLKMPQKRLAHLWQGPLGKVFYTNGDGRLHNHRLEKEREKQEAFRRRASDGGHARAAHKQPSSSPQAVLNPCLPPKRSSPQARENPALLSSISDLPTPVPNKERSVGPPKEPADPNVRTFLQWFQTEYKHRRQGADYLVRWDKDGAIVKTLLKATSLERLQNLARVMLSDKCEDEFIVGSDRGIGVLSARFNWLSDRVAAWEAKRASS